MENGWRTLKSMFLPPIRIRTSTAEAEGDFHERLGDLRLIEKDFKQRADEARTWGERPYPGGGLEEFSRKLGEHCDVLDRTITALNEAETRRLAPPEVLSIFQRGDEHAELDLAGTSASIDEQLAPSRDPAERRRLADKKAIAGEQGPGERGPKARGFQALLARDLSGPFNQLRAEIETWVEHSRLDVVIVALTEKMRADKPDREAVFTGTNELFPDLTARDIAARVVGEWFGVGWDRVQRAVSGSGSG